MTAFLGNPGQQYRLTRHNLGWLLLENLSFHGDLLWKSKFKGEYAQLGSGSGRMIFLKPETFMNQSGDSLQSALVFFKMKPENLLVAHDDIELPFGRYQLRRGGGLGGHNGLRSIAGKLGTGDFYRLRLGVGRPARGDVASYVLGRFSPQEEAELTLLYPRGEAVLSSLTALPPEKLPPSLAAGDIRKEVS